MKKIIAIFLVIMLFGILINGLSSTLTLDPVDVDEVVTPHNP